MSLDVQICVISIEVLITHTVRRYKILKRVFKQHGNTRNICFTIIGQFFALGLQGYTRIESTDVP